METEPMSDEELAKLREKLSQSRTVTICPDCKVEPCDHSMHPDHEGVWHARCHICLDRLVEVELRPLIDPTNLCGSDVEDLLDEVERLRTALQAEQQSHWRCEQDAAHYRDENAAMREIVRMVAALNGNQSPNHVMVCRGCGGWIIQSEHLTDTGECPLTKAQALVTQWRAAETAETAHPQPCYCETCYCDGCGTARHDCVCASSVAEQAESEASE